jgi:hypothetical protein
MGKRSRKQRPEGTTRAERDARRQAAATTATRRRSTGAREAPPAPWGSFPLTEITVLIALVFGIVGFIRFGTHSGRVLIAAAMCLGSLGGLEVSIREHFAGYRSHSTLLAGSCAIAFMILFSVVAGKTAVGILGIAVGLGLLVFLLSFWAFRQAFIRRSGGLGFR